jgi:SET domain-containing protein
VVVAPSPIDGRGVFARRDIAAGTYIGSYEGKTARRNGKYVLWVEDGEETIGRSGTPPLKFLNHSDEPNAYFDGFDLYAEVDIRQGQEITFDYGEEWREA